MILRRSVTATDLNTCNVGSDKLEGEPWGGGGGGAAAWASAVCLQVVPSVMDTTWCLSAGWTPGSISTLCSSPSGTLCSAPACPATPGKKLHSGRTPSFSPLFVLRIQEVKPDYSRVGWMEPGFLLTGKRTHSVGLFVCSLRSGSNWKVSGKREARHVLQVYFSRNSSSRHFSLYFLVTF